MDSCVTYLIEPIAPVALKKVALKDLEPDIENLLVVGVIIAKQRPRKFSDKSKEGDSFRAVWNFTLRDSLRDYINVTYWGSSEEIIATNERFYSGDVVEIRNPKIVIRKFNDNGEQFRPMVTSPYHINLTEHSEILPHTGDSFLFKKLLNCPTKPIAGFVPFRDIHNQGANMKERFIDILGAVRSVGETKNITTKIGMENQLREVVLFDHTSPGLKLTIWETDVIIRAGSWKPRSTILFITDARVEWSNFSRAYTASLTSRSIVTENPVGEEVVTLKAYAKDAPLETSAILDQLVTALPDPDSIQNVMSVQQVCTNIENLCQNNTGTEHQFTALMFVFVTKLDLDGQSMTTRIKCVYCRSRLNTMSSICENPECLVNQGAANNNVDVSFDIRINLADHTGTLTNCRLSGSSAEQVLQCSVQQFLRMTNEQKRNLKWKFLMERCAVCILVLRMNRATPVMSVVSCARADPMVTAQKIPTY